MQLPIELIELVISKLNLFVKLNLIRYYIKKLIKKIYYISNTKSAFSDTQVFIRTR